MYISLDGLHLLHPLYKYCWSAVPFPTVNSVNWKTYIHLGPAQTGKLIIFYSLNLLLKYHLILNSYQLQNTIKKYRIKSFALTLIVSSADEYSQKLWNSFYLYT